MKKIVTRFAPSPTGKPHVGNIRTAIYAYLWARHNNGSFLLRIEDTDRERLVPESLKYIEESLHWLGINYDEEIIHQSERKDIHQNYANTLLNNNNAYMCFCTKERLEKLRENQAQKKLPPGYDGFCRELSPKKINEKKNQKYVIRFKMPKEGTANWDDGVRGKMSIDYKISDDPVLIKSDGWPTYHLASVVDDYEQGVTDIIRGEEWISSTPKHLAIYNAFGWTPPKFSHLPLIKGADGSKLSKRHGDTAILDYKKNGYLPEAIFNFLTLLGWNDGTEKEIFTKEELVKLFDIKRIGKSPAIFDIKKLNWINGQYIRQASSQELLTKINNLYPKNKIIKLDNFKKIFEVEKSRLEKLSDILVGTEYYLSLPKYPPSMLIFKKSNPKDTLKGLNATLSYLKKNKWPENIDNLNNILAKIAKENNLSNGDVFWPVRVALSGKEKSPSPAEILWVFGKDESLKRINIAIKTLAKT